MVLAMKICPICNTEFEPKHRGHKYCSFDCGYSSMRVKQTQKYALNQFQIFQRDNFRCIYCGKSSIEDNVKLNIDHIVSHKSKGENTFGNLVTACSQCNSSKKNRPIQEPGLSRLLAEVKKRNLAIGRTGNEYVVFAR